MAQPKRLALLAYLAAHAPEGEIRERLLHIFWPENDSDHARLSLRQALHFIRAVTRKAGEPDILVSSMGGRLRLDPNRVSCDMMDFDTKLTAGDYAGALALYRGDFLQDVYVGRAPEFERWLDGERTRLRLAAEMAGLRASTQRPDQARTEWPREERRKAPARDFGAAVLAISIRDLDIIELDRGAAEAEQALTLIAQALRETFRKSDVIARQTRNRFVVTGSDWSGQGLASAITRLTGTTAARAAIRLGYRVELDISREEQPSPTG